MLYHFASLSLADEFGLVASIRLVARDSTISKMFLRQKWILRDASFCLRFGERAYNRRAAVKSVFRLPGATRYSQRIGYSWHAAVRRTKRMPRCTARGYGRNARSNWSYLIQLEELKMLVEL